MLRNFLPKEYNFYDYFENHIKLCIEVSNEFLLLSDDFSRFEESNIKIKKLEKEMDTITHQCTDALLHTFITPFERTDIHRLIKRMDDIADGINSTMLKMKLYNISDFKPDAKPLVKLIHKSVLELDVAIHLLRNIKNPDDIKTNCYNIRKYEKEADEIYRNSIAKLFETTDVIDLIKWKEIYERLEKIMGKTEEVAGIILRIVIESA